MELAKLGDLFKISEVVSREKKNTTDEPSISFEEEAENIRRAENRSAALKKAALKREFGQDEVTISREAKIAFELERIIRRVRGAPDIRPDRLEVVKEKIANGGLLIREVSEEVAERIRERLSGREMDLLAPADFSEQRIQNAVGLIAKWFGF